jgi:hypothetical protein
MPEKVNRARKAWHCMRSRCEDERNISYKWYGGRGIKVCERWQIFDNFLADMGYPPLRMSLDRIDNNGDYELSNCRWATATEQSRNTSRTVFITIDGDTKCLKEWSLLRGLNPSSVWWRIKRGWSPLDALSVPPIDPTRRNCKQRIPYGGDRAD